MSQKRNGSKGGMSVRWIPEVLKSKATVGGGASLSHISHVLSHIWERFGNYILPLE